MAGDSEPQSDLKLRPPEAADQRTQRTQIRRAAKAAKTSIEIKPCPKRREPGVVVQAEVVKRVAETGRETRQCAPSHFPGKYQ
jgi:hypothetical protein